MWRGWINTILAHLSPGVRDRKCACERHLVKANTTSEIFREGKKYAQDRSGPCHQRVSNTLQAIFFPPRPCHAPPLLGAPMPPLPPPFPKPVWVRTLSCSDGNKRAPSPGAPPAWKGHPIIEREGQCQRGAGSQAHLILPPVELASSS